MASATSNEKQQAHELIDRLAPSQVSAPVDDEPVTPEEERAVARSEAWFEKRGGKGIPMEEVMAEFGLTPEDLAEKNAPRH